jgi:hypothetical protein
MAYKNSFGRWFDYIFHSPLQNCSTDPPVETKEKWEELEHMRRREFITLLTGIAFTTAQPCKKACPSATPKSSTILAAGMLRASPMFWSPLGN